MAKVKKAASPLTKQRVAFVTTVKMCMMRQDIDSIRELAPLVGINERMLYRKFRWEAHWTLEDLFRLVRVLRPTSEELETMMGVIGNA